MTNNTKCKSGGAGRNESGFLDLYCEHCKQVMTDEDENTRDCITYSQDSDTCNYLYSEVKRLEAILKDIKLFVIEDVPHQYQERILNRLSDELPITPKSK